MSQSNPIKLFVSHTFQEHDDYFRVFEYLESSSNFFYINYAAPDQMPEAGGKEAIREVLREQIKPVEAVIISSTMYSENIDWLTFQMDAAQAMEKPIIAMEAFGATSDVPEEIKKRADEVVEWNARSLVDAIRRQARHEDTSRWEVIDFP